MKYLIGALVILALLFLAWWFLSRGKQAKLDEQRAEAARIRAGADERSAALRGQEAFVQQADERASTARQEAEERARQAEESAREAQRVEDEARRHQDELERSRLAHEAQLRRADEIDPDVDVAKDDPRPLPEDLDDDVRPLDDTRVHTPVSAAAADGEPETRVHTPVPAAQSDTSVSQRDVASDADTTAEAESTGAWTSPSQTEGSQERSGWVTGAAATGAGAAAIGSAYAATHGDVSDDEAARLASGADYADHEPAPGGGAREANSVESGSIEPVAQQSTDADAAQQDWPAGDVSGEETVAEESVAAPVSAGSVTPESSETSEAADVSETSATTTPATWDEDSEPVHEPSSEPVSEPVADSPRAQDWDADNRDDVVATDSTTTDATPDSDARDDESFAESDHGDVDPADGDMAIIGNVEDYASTEPLPAESSPVTADGSSSADDSASTDWSTSDEPSAVVAEAGPGSTDATAPTQTWDDGRVTAAEDDNHAEVADESTQLDTTARTDDGADVDDAAAVDEPTTEETWEDAEPASDTATDSSADSVSDTAAATDVAPDAGRDGADATHWADGTDRINPVDDASEATGSDATDSADTDTDADTVDTDSADSGSADTDSADSGSADSGDAAAWSRRISGIDEIRDGGHGVGSAAPLEDRAQPLDHPVQAYNDTRTFRVPGVSGYDSAEPDVWFYDEEAARRAGFTPSEG